MELLIILIKKDGVLSNITLKLLVCKFVSHDFMCIVFSAYVNESIANWSINYSDILRPIGSMAYGK